MKHLLLCLLFGATAVHAIGQDRYELHSGWQYAMINTVSVKGDELSRPGFSLKGWRAATVPGTVLTNMLHHQKVPDPFYGMNNERIPDIYHTGRDYYTAWFVNNFREARPVNGQQVWLDLRGVNYSCEVFLNGHLLNEATHKGMFLRQSYNITRYLAADGNNRLAVVVYPPDPVGNPNGGQGGDGRIAKNVSTQYVAGWDWIQPVRDRNTGIWDKVFIERTGVVNLRNPHIVTRVPGERHARDEAQPPATVQMTVELENTSARTVKGVVQYTLEGVKLQQAITLQPACTTLVKLADLTIERPRLWWPVGYGMQDLYTMELQFIADGQISDREAVSFGVREISRTWNKATQSSEIRVNGLPIFIKGGNWIISDAMLRLSEARYDDEVHHHRDMGLNLIRIWGGALLERPEFYKACDKYGLLVFQDLWMSGDCNGRWLDPKKAEDQATRRQYPDDHGLFLRSVEDGIKLIRNHASLAIWCGGNEITPPDDILRAVRDTLLPELDGTRIFFDYSNSDSMSLNTLGGNGDGPYNIQPIDTFWQHRTWPFNSEVGSVGLGDYASLQRFIPSANLQQWPVYTPALGEQREREKADSVWEYHKYIGYKQYITAYGPVKDVRDFARKAQLVNYDQYRALAEGFAAHRWQWYTGYIIWKTQNPWTALRGQMYDYYLDPNACYYGLRTGTRDRHIMYNPVTGQVMINNEQNTPYGRVTVRAVAYDMAGKKYPLLEETAYVTGGRSYTLSSVKRQLDILRVKAGIFLALKATDEAGHFFDDQVYWLPDSSGQYSGLQTLAPAALSVTVGHVKPGSATLTLRNAAGQPVSFFNRITLLHPVTRERILPAFYSDNYVSVLPGGWTFVAFDWKDHSITPIVEIEGWNTPTISVVLPSPSPAK
ncbi:glycoside hydrolase family 2 protein [Paraflavitalea pollutisoli]|uniref:glycoside hydrolase family 2 protein n=1 Tax=Paraflavitalea pollutisoli TaxID=3034143 RepID=UPI0023EDED38|nr:glycosyl hydrolase [Paraflavitalea sp. H1-2-19X]